MCSRRDFTFPVLLLLFLLLLLLLGPIPGSVAQDVTPPPPNGQTSEEACKGVFLRYAVTESKKTYPFLSDESPSQAFAFGATASILNADDVPLSQWTLHVAYPNGTILVSAANAVITDGSAFPHTVGADGVSFSGSPNPDLKTAIETAGDVTQIQAEINIVGTLFGSTTQLPSNILLENPEFICPNADRSLTSMSTCCRRNPNFNSTKSPISSVFLPRRTGDLTISYDVTESADSNYLATVRINNSNPLGRLDDWRLTWEWMRGEFVFRTQGAYTTQVGSSDCIFGAQGQFYKDLDMSTVQNCQRTPTFLDLPVSMTNDSKLGLIPFCCRNGTILPTTMDAEKSMSEFQIQVFKMPPDLNRTVLFPPQNWKIVGSSTALNPTYVCGQPIRVSPTLFPDPNGLPSWSPSIAGWQVVCNISRPTGTRPKCCVSFSAFYNDSVVPCKTCACGCNSTNACSTTAQAMLLPSEQLLVPFDNRTKKALAWAEMKRFNVPDPLPCGDNCGVTLNWHVNSDFRDGWTARITLLNWETADIPDWFAAVVMDHAYDGLKEMYSFNASQLGNKTIFMQGNQGLNYLLKMNTDKDPMDPGKLQSVVLFDKKKTPGIDDVVRGKFPTKVFFNGEECSLPDVLPSGHGHRDNQARPLMFTFLVVVIVSLLLPNCS